MAEEPKEKEQEQKTSADEIEHGRKRQKRTDQERLSYLEDENDTLRESNKTLEKQFNDLCKTFKIPAGKEHDEDFWQSLASELGL